MIDNCDMTPSTGDRVKRVARWTWGKVKRVPEGFRSFCGYLLPVGVLAAGIIVLREQATRPGTTGAEVMWWIGYGLVCFAVIAIYNRGEEAGRLEGMRSIVNVAADRIAQLSTRSIHVTTDVNLVNNTGQSLVLVREKEEV